MNCPKCDADTANEATFCNSCGYKLSGDGQILSTNAVVSLQDKSTEIFNRATYSTLTKVLFFSTLVAMLGGILSMFSLVEGAYAFSIPCIIMFVVIIYQAIIIFIDINVVADTKLAQILRQLLTFMAYSLFLMAFGCIVLGVAELAGSWKYSTVLDAYTGLTSAYGGVITLSFFAIAVIHMICSIRFNQR